MWPVYFRQCLVNFVSRVLELQEKVWARKVKTLLWGAGFWLLFGPPLLSFGENNDGGKS